MDVFTPEDNALIDKEFEELRLASLKRCADQSEYEMVLKAFEFARSAHNGVRRRSGEPYIIHPICVAKIVVQEIGLGYKSIVSALIHDVVEDTEYNIEDIERLFGAKIASLVDGLTKIKSVFDSSTTGQAENFKRILLTLNDDVRVILIKLADRLHNMRTIDSMPQLKKDKILSETMYIFIPLAHRLGLYSIKSEMEDIWLKHSFPKEYDEIQARIAKTVAERGFAIDQFIEPIAESLRQDNYEFTITKRTKTPYSIWRKMIEKHITFDEVYDLFAVRIVFEPKPNQPERVQCWHIYSLITENYLSKTDRIRDWVSTPKANGYEALHCTVLGKQGNWIEVQIRSKRMDDVAERGIAAHWAYKGAKPSESELENWLNRVREVLENPDVNALTFLDNFHKELFSKEIFAFTPKGDSISLPKGSTALDFAYAIHSEIGNKAIAAKVNYKLFPLSYQVRNGDQIEIITAESQKPQREWLDFVKTPKARFHIMDVLNAEGKALIKEGQNKLNAKLNELNIASDPAIYKKLLELYKQKDKDELLSRIGASTIDLSDLKEKLNSYKDKSKSFFKKKNKVEDFLLEENPMDKTLTYVIASCCSPIPGDPVIGFQDDNGKVIVHKKDCPKAIALASSVAEKIVKVKWAVHTSLSFLARVTMKGLDRKGILNEITQIIAKVMNINIRKVIINTHDNIFEGCIDLDVHNKDDLDKLIKELSMVKGIENVLRNDIKEDVINEN
jgi:GTP pyrophosphokinase